MVAISTDIAVPADIDRVEVSAVRDYVDDIEYAPEPFDAALLPGTIRLDCTEGSALQRCSGEVRIAVTGKLGTTEARVARVASLAFVDAAIVSVELPLCASCDEIICESWAETCRAGRCVDNGVVSPAAYDAAQAFASDECSIVPSVSCAETDSCPDTPMIATGSDLVDAHEVTRADYAAFLASNPSVRGQVPLWLFVRRAALQRGGRPARPDDPGRQLRLRRRARHHRSQRQRRRVGRQLQRRRLSPPRRLVRVRRGGPALRRRRPCPPHRPPAPHRLPLLRLSRGGARVRRGARPPRASRISPPSRRSISPAGGGRRPRAGWRRGCSRRSCRPGRGRGGRRRR